MFIVETTILLFVLKVGVIAWPFNVKVRCVSLFKQSKYKGDIMGSSFDTIFIKQYPAYTLAKDNSAIEFSDGGSNYRVYLPTGTFHKDGSMDVQVNLDHILGGSPDDHATITVSFDPNGKYCKGSPSVTTTWSGGTQIPDWVIDTTDGIVTVGGVATGLVVGVITGAAIEGATAGLGTPVAVVLGIGADAVTTVILEGIGWGISASMSLFNYLSKTITDMSDDGGSIYFTEVIAHTLNRLSTTVLEYNGGEFVPTLRFDYSDFLDALGQSSWDDKAGAAVKYKYSGDHFRTWKQDYSANYLNIGMLVSCKIDGIRDNNTDDHVILAASYDVYGQLYSAQATVRMENEPTVTTGSIMYNNGQLVQVTSSSVVDASSYNGIIDAISGIMQNEMKNNSNYDNYSDQRKHLPHVTKLNLTSMASAIAGGASAPVDE